MLSKKSKFILGMNFLYILASPMYAAQRVNVQHNKQDAVIDLNLLSKDYYKFYSAGESTFASGKTRYKLEQHYLEIPIWDNAVVSKKQNVGEFIDNDVVAGSFLTGVEEDLPGVQPIVGGPRQLIANISEQQAIEIAKRRVLTPTLAATGAKITNVKSNKFIKLYADKDNPNQEKAHLIHVVDLVITNEQSEEPRRPFTIIDAQTGDILEEWEGMTFSTKQEQYQNATGPGGNEKIGRYMYGKDYGYLIVNNSCSMTSPNVDTYNMNGKTAGEILYRFTCPENTDTTINGGYSPLNDAHYYGNVVYDMYKTWYDLPPLNKKLKMRVHYGVNYQNAFWDGEQMTFGDGGSRLYPLTVIDVAGHEVSHGFTEQNSQLVYKQQSGGINESFSDMAGEATEYFFNKDKPDGQRNDWLVGEGAVRGDRGKALRYFDKPSRDGRSLDDVSGYYDSIDPHFSSGVYNRVFYILANKPSWNVQKAFHVFLIANQLYWTQNTDYNTGACGAVNAAKDLDLRATDVYDAFKTVGVNPTCGVDEQDPGPVPIPGATELKNGVTVGPLTGKKGENKLYYIDVPKDNLNTLTVWNFNGGRYKPITQVAYGQVPTSANVECTSTSSNRYCYIPKPKKGRYYINVTSNATYSNVSLWAFYN